MSFGYPRKLAMDRLNHKFGSGSDRPPKYDICTIDEGWILSIYLDRMISGSHAITISFEKDQIHYGFNSHLNFIQISHIDLSTNYLFLDLPKKGFDSLCHKVVLTMVVGVFSRLSGSAFLF